MTRLSRFLLTWSNAISKLLKRMLRKHFLSSILSKLKSITLDLLKLSLKVKSMPSTSSETALTRRFLREDFSSKWEDNKKNMLKTGLQLDMFPNHSNKHPREISNMIKNPKKKKELNKDRKYNNQKSKQNHKEMYSRKQANKKLSIKFKITLNIKHNTKLKRNLNKNNKSRFKRKLNQKYNLKQLNPKHYNITNQSSIKWSPESNINQKPQKKNLSNLLSTRLRTSNIKFSPKKIKRLLRRKNKKLRKRKR